MGEISRGSEFESMGMGENRPDPDRENTTSPEIELSDEQIAEGLKRFQLIQSNLRDSLGAEIPQALQENPTFLIEILETFTQEERRGLRDFLKFQSKNKGERDIEIDPQIQKFTQLIERVIQRDDKRDQADAIKGEEESPSLVKMRSFAKKLSPALSLFALLGIHGKEIKNMQPPTGEPPVFSAGSEKQPSPVEEILSKKSKNKIPDERVATRQSASISWNNRTEAQAEQEFAGEKTEKLVLPKAEDLWQKSRDFWKDKSPEELEIQLEREELIADQIAEAYNNGLDIVNEHDVVKKAQLTAKILAEYRNALGELGVPPASYFANPRGDFENQLMRTFFFGVDLDSNMLNARYTMEEQGASNTEIAATRAEADLAMLYMETGGDGELFAESLVQLKNLQINDMDQVSELNTLALALGGNSKASPSSKQMPRQIAQRFFGPDEKVADVLRELCITGDLRDVDPFFIREALQSALTRLEVYNRNEMPDGYEIVDPNTIKRLLEKY